jgi:hypothetical protein
MWRTNDVGSKKKRAKVPTMPERLGHRHWFWIEFRAATSTDGLELLGS